MSFITSNVEIKVNKLNILAISAEAKKQKKIDPSIIDATAGMLFNDDGSLYAFRCVEKTIANLNNREKYAYGSSKCQPDFKDAVLKWVFQDKLESVLSKSNAEVVATPGGTGAIANTIENYLKEGNTFVVSNFMWTNYLQIAKNHKVNVSTYEFFDGDHFNQKGFEDAISETAKKENQIFFILNDPCQNPTGYGLTSDEFDKVIESLNKQTCKVVFLLDLAYVDYDTRGFEYSRAKLEKLTNLNDNILPILCFSSSKTLSLYGLRCGAQICLSKNSEDIREFVIANEYSARAIWSCTPVLSQNIVTKCFNDYYDDFKDELGFTRNIIKERSEKFLEYAKKYGLKHYPFTNGFFVTVLANNPYEFFEKCRDLGLYAVPMTKGVRLTLSAINVKEIEKAVSIMSKVQQENL